VQTKVRKMLQLRRGGAGTPWEATKPLGHNSQKGAKMGEVGFQPTAGNPEETARSA